MTKQEFEEHIEAIIVDAFRIERYKDDKGIVTSHRKDIHHHCKELMEFYDRNKEES